MQLFTECPFRLVDAEMWDVILLAEQAAKGSWPIAGGTLRQSYSFVQAVQAIANEQRRYE